MGEGSGLDAVVGRRLWRVSDSDGQILHLAEDIGRHNAFDKLVGALARLPGGRPPGFAVLTSRLSYELVQKAATTSIPALVAISAPTALEHPHLERNR
jgi:FdhD protein